MFGILNVCEALISRVGAISEAKVVILLKESILPVPGVAEVVLALSLPVIAVVSFVVVVEVFGSVPYGGLKDPCFS